MSTEHFDAVAKGLATTWTRRRALAVLAGGIAAIWGLSREPGALANQACANSEECRDTSACCCIHPHNPNPGVCLRPDVCATIGGFCTKKR